MITTLVADRLVRDSTGAWRDLATGRVVSLHVRDRSACWDARAHELANALMRPEPDGRTLVDFGLLDTSRCFEAYTAWPALSPARDQAAIGQAVQRAVARAASQEGRSGSTMVDLTCREADWEHLVVELARGLRDLGFVLLRSSMAIPAAVIDEVCHRHVAVVSREEDPSAVHAPWIRRVARLSPRRHLLCCLRAPASVDAGLAVRERSAFLGPASSTCRVPVLLARGELRAAESVLAAERLLHAACGADPPEELLSWQLSLSFWQGRFDAARALLRSMGPAADRTGWMGLLAWAAFDLEEAEACRLDCARLARRGEFRARFWARLLAALGRSTGQPTPGGASRRRIRSFRWTAAAPAELRLVAELAAAEGAIVDGHGRALRRYWWRRGVLGRSDLRGLAARWVAFRRMPPYRDVSVERQLVARGALGVFRWGLGRQRMRILHFVPGLLQVVHDAEDEAVALRAGCSWIRTHAGATAVAVVAGPNLDVIAEEGWSGRLVATNDLHDLCREVPRTASAAGEPDALAHAGAPVRYGGAVIGHVIGRGVVADMGTMSDAVQAFAALSGPALRARLDAAGPIDDLGTVMPELVGRSRTMVTVRESIRQAARTSFPVLIEGESGTGKELAARALHRLSARRSRRFMAVNCAALTDELVEAELFGFARGAFTGAITARPGLFEEAHGGSLFLDEAGELSARAQAKLLRALQEREVRRVGENAARAVDVRVIAATNRPLAEAVAARAFREDLMFRLAVVRIVLPPLRDRLDDLPALASAFWRQAMNDVGKQARLTREAVGALCDHHWPGNVRELQNVMAGLAVRAPARGPLGARQVRLQLAGAAPGERPAGSLGDLRRQCERHAVACALARHGGRRTAAARELGLSRQGLAKAIRRLGVTTPNEAAGVA